MDDPQPPPAAPRYISWRREAFQMLGVSLDVGWKRRPDSAGRQGGTPVAA